MICGLSSEATGHQHDFDPEPVVSKDLVGNPYDCERSSSVRPSAEGLAIGKAIHPGNEVKVHANELPGFLERRYCGCPIRKLKAASAMGLPGLEPFLV